MEGEGSTGQHVHLPVSLIIRSSSLSEVSGVAGATRKRRPVPSRVDPRPTPREKGRNIRLKA